MRQKNFERGNLWLELVKALHPRKTQKPLITLDTFCRGYMRQKHFERGNFWLELVAATASDPINPAAY
jgi:hypothetical protein